MPIGLGTIHLLLIHAGSLLFSFEFGKTTQRVYSRPRSCGFIFVRASTMTDRCVLRARAAGASTRTHDAIGLVKRRPSRRTHPSLELTDIVFITAAWRDIIIIIIIIIISTTMFMVLSSWQSHCESSPGSFDECRSMISPVRSGPVIVKAFWPTCNVQAATDYL